MLGLIRWWLMWFDTRFRPPREVPEAKIRQGIAIGGKYDQDKRE